MDAVKEKNAKERETWGYEHLIDDGFYGVRLRDGVASAEEGVLSRVLQTWPGSGCERERERSRERLRCVGRATG